MIQIAGKYHSTKLEGGDAVGKETLSDGIVTALLQLGYPVIKTNYPQYWFTGKMIRNFLRKEAGNEFLHQLAPTRAAQVRAAAYALDRAFSLLLLIPRLEQNPHFQHISDRGPMSNIVSAAYIWHNNPDLTADDLTAFLENTFPKIEIEMRQELGDQALLCLTGENLSSSIFKRDKLDLYDTPDVQHLATEIYKSQIPQSNHIVTKRNGVWRPLEHSVPESLAAMHVPIDRDLQLEPADRKQTLQSAVRSGQLEIVGPHHAINSLITPDSIDPRLQEEFHILKFLADEWLETTLTPEEELPGDASQKPNKKNFMEAQENLFYSAMLGFFATADLTQTNLSPIGLRAIHRLITDYPEILKLMEIGMGPDIARQFEILASMATEA